MLDGTAKSEEGITMIRSFADILKERKSDLPQLEPKVVDQTGNQTTEQAERSNESKVEFNGESIEEKPKRLTPASVRQQQKDQILAQHGGLISNIPMNSKYWSL